MSIQTSRAPSAPMGPGDVVASRYRILEVLEAPSLWGAVFLASDETQPGREVVLKQMRIPPLRQGLEERVARVHANIKACQENAHKSRASIIDSFEEDRAIWLVMLKAPGIDVTSFLKQKKKVVKAEWQAGIAVNLAAALAALLTFDQGRQFVMEMTPRNVLITPGGDVTIVGFGLNRCFKPGTPPDPAGNAPEVSAMRRFGELMFGLLTGEAYTQASSIIDSALPEDLGYVVLRALLPSRPQYPSMAALIKELSLFRKVLVAENRGTLSWEEIEMADVDIPWRKRYFPPFLYQASERVVDFAQARPGLVRGVAVALLLGFAVYWIVSLRESALSRTVAHASGPALYVVEKGGMVELVSVSQRRSLGAFHTGEVAGSVYSTRTGKAYFTVPSEQKLFVCNFADNETSSYPFPPDCLQRLYSVAGDTFALSVGTTSTVGSIDLAAPRPRNPIELSAAPLDLVYGTALNAVIYLRDPEHVEAYSVLTRKVVKRLKLETPARALRSGPGARQLWFVPARSGAPVNVHDAVTFAQIGTLEVPADQVVDIILKQEWAYILLSSGKVALVAHKSLHAGQVTPLAVDHTLSLPVRASGMLLPVPSELWLLLNEEAVLIYDLATGSSTRVSLRGTPLRAIMAVPRSLRGE